ncbi:MAG: YhbY family RNA-binding protein [Betaproteobacteria bacterium]
MKSTLSPIERRALKAQAHALDPVVMIGDQGLTPAVILEIERNLKAHELIKVRASSDDREARESWLNEISLALHAAPVQHIGKMLVIWRKKPAEADKKLSSGRTDRRTGAKVAAKSGGKSGAKFGVKSGVTTRSQRKPREKGVAVPTSKGTGKGSSGFGTRVSARRQTRTK